MRAKTWGATSALALLLGCGSWAPVPLGHQPAASGSVASSARPGTSSAQPAGPPPRPAHTQALGAETTEVLPFEVRPSTTPTAALLVHADLLRGVSYLRRIDDAQRLGPIKVLVGRHLATALDTATPSLASSDGQRLCFEGFAPGDAPVCHALRADVAVVVGARTLLLEQRDDSPPPPEEPVPAPKKPKPAPKPVSPTPMRVWIHEIDAAGARVGEARDSGFTFELPLVGMGIVGAAPTKKGVRVVYYEHKNPRSDGKHWIQQARLATVRLDAKGELVAGSKATIYEGDKLYGFIDGHDTPQVFANGERALVVGRWLDKSTQPPVSRFEGYTLGPVAQLSAQDAAYAVDPWRLASGKALAGSEAAALAAIWQAAPRLAAGQGGADAGRVAWAGARGYFLKDGKLHSAARADGTLGAEAEPFSARRSHIRWGSIEANGAGLAFAGGDLHEVAPDGSLTHHPSVGADIIGRPAHIGESWWAAVPTGSRGSGVAIQRLLPSPLEATALTPLAYADGSALVGGATGMFVALHGQRLALWQLKEDGSAAQLAVHASALGRGLDAAPRAAGGALVVGHRQAPPHEALALAFDAQGALVGEATLALGAGKLSIVAQAGGGALVFDEPRTRVAWLDDSAKELGTAAWTGDAAAIGCVDGAPLPLRVPGAKPGEIEALGKLAGDYCSVMPLPARLADGSLRWLGSVVSGIDSRAVLAWLPGTAPAGLAAASAAPRTASAAPPKPPCPPDMVSIGGNYCIDRYEVQLWDGGELLSPDFPTTPGILEPIFKVWAAGRWTTGDLHAHAMPLPALWRAQSATPSPAARSRQGVRPSGYLTWFAAELACKGAGKRLCTLDEWRTACRGEQDRLFPYGDDYQLFACNVHRYAHPAATLHGNAAVGHLDPRLNRVLEGKAPLMRLTGATPACASRWGDDAVYDMVGNLDEWIDEKNGAFAGGFYSRTTLKGCDALISAHPKKYLDYSLGTRCCQAASP